MELKDLYSEIRAFSNDDQGSSNYYKDEYFVQGEKDFLTPPDITRAYFDKIQAPEKEYFLLPNAAHGHNQAVVDTQYRIVKDYIYLRNGGK